MITKEFRETVHLDCDDFEERQENEFPRYIGECQTNGHFLCAKCRHIASFEDMEEGDNKMRYYPKETKEWLVEQEREYQKRQEY